MKKEIEEKMGKAGKLKNVIEGMFNLVSEFEKFKKDCPDLIIEMKKEAKKAGVIFDDWDAFLFCVYYLYKKTEFKK